MLAYVVTVTVLTTVAGVFFLVATRSSRTLPEPVRREVAMLPARRPGQHVVDLELADGRVVEQVWVAYGRYVALIGGRQRSHRYVAADVVHARPPSCSQPT